MSLAQPARTDQMPDDITPEMLDKVDQICAAHRGGEGALIPVLQQVQEVVGYLPPAL